jgi:hypothetical protein
MNSKMKPLLRTIGAGLLLGAALAASANTIVTFQVDMSTAAFDPNTQTVSVHGSFNGWGAFNLTNNPNGPTPNIWSETTNLALNGVVVAYKYVIDPGAHYEGVRSGGGHNRLITLPTTSGASFPAPLVYYGDVTPGGVDITNTVTFQVNLAQQINVGNFIVDTSTNYVRGFFNGWGQSLFSTNDPSIHTTNQFGLVSSNVYVASVDVTGSPGQTVDYKNFIDTGSNWESPGPGVGDPSDNNNRFFNLATSAQVLPIIYFNDAPYAPKSTNAITFQVDMTAQVINGNFNPVGGTVEVRGNFNSWGTPQILCTNDPTAVNTNLYSTVVTITDGVGASEFYKFWASVSVNTGWETMADNRSLRIVSGTAQVLPPVFFSNVDPSDLLPADTTVTFQVSMTNAVGTDAHPFDPVNDAVFINGVPTFATWDTFLPQCTNNPVGSRIYSIDLLVPKGGPVQQTYKYGINGVDDEAGAGQNHVRYIRSTGTYVMPLDVFGNQLVESSFGDLKATASIPGRVLISWTGRPGVHLQTKPALVGSWTDHPETDGLSSTNWPTDGNALLFRLVRP